MGRLPRIASWLVAGGVSAVALQGTSWGAGERLRPGATEVTLAGGYSISHNITRAVDLEQVHAGHALPHIGFVLTDELGGGWWRGNFQILLEPTMIRLDASESATIYGGSVLGRWLSVGSDRIRPFAEVGLGVLDGEIRLRQTDCNVNFIVQGGVGALVFLSARSAITLGYRFQHVSNAGRCSPNVGLNSSLFILGVSHFFP